MIGIHFKGWLVWWSPCSAFFPAMIGPKSGPISKHDGRVRSDTAREIDHGVHTHLMAGYEDLRRVGRLQGIWRRVADDDDGIGLPPSSASVMPISANDFSVPKRIFVLSSGFRISGPRVSII